MISIESLKSLVLDLPPSCIEFWLKTPQYAVVGTYNLEKTDTSPEGDEDGHTVDTVETKAAQQRNGSLILVYVDDDDVKIVQTLATPSAILDIHFDPLHPSAAQFGVATSTGSIGIYQVGFTDREPNATPRIFHVKTLQYFPEDVLVTAFSWHPQSHLVGMTLSDGEVWLAQTDVENVEAELRTSWKVGAHELEAWTLAFLPDGAAVYTGGDDSALRIQNLPNEQEEIYNVDHVQVEGTRMSWVDKRIHGAGVTAILPLDANEERVLLVTGSYDDHIRLISAPALGRRQVLAEMDLGGGVWRLKRLDPRPTFPTPKESSFEEILLLASCMHAGARILKLSRVSSDDWTFEILAKFEEHKSMNYGSDCQPRPNSNEQRTFITTSFYDRLLCLWRY